MIDSFNKRSTKCVPGPVLDAEVLAVKSGRILTASFCNQNM